jgi:hypothetical protein
MLLGEVRACEYLYAAVPLTETVISLTDENIMLLNAACTLSMGKDTLSTYVNDC